MHENPFLKFEVYELLLKTYFRKLESIFHPQFRTGVKLYGYILPKFTNLSPATNESTHNQYKRNRVLKRIYDDESISGLFGDEN